MIGSTNIGKAAVITALSICNILIYQQWILLHLKLESL